LDKRLFVGAMNLHEAIKIAIENGWTTFKGNKIDSVRFIDSGDKRLAEIIEEERGHPSSSTILSYDEFFLDPLFWQSLGKGLGWDETVEVERPDFPLTPALKATQWKVHWHHFIDAIAEGRKPEEFFREL
jgi:hypothetical protein